jgi:hypothetical protein
MALALRSSRTLARLCRKANVELRVVNRRLLSGQLVAQRAVFEDVKAVCASTTSG